MDPKLMKELILQSLEKEVKVDVSQQMEIKDEMLEQMANKGYNPMNLKKRKNEFS